MKNQLNNALGDEGRKLAKIRAGPVDNVPDVNFAIMYDPPHNYRPYKAPEELQAVEAGPSNISRQSKVNTAAKTTSSSQPARDNGPEAKRASTSRRRAARVAKISAKAKGKQPEMVIDKHPLKRTRATENEQEYDLNDELPLPSKRFKLSSAASPGSVTGESEVMVPAEPQDDAPGSAMNEMSSRSPVVHFQSSVEPAATNEDEQIAEELVYALIDALASLEPSKAKGACSALRHTAQPSSPSESPVSSASGAIPQFKTHGPGVNIAEYQQQRAAYEADFHNKRVRPDDDTDDEKLWVPHKRAKIPTVSSEVPPSGEKNEATSPPAAHGDASESMTGERSMHERSPVARSVAESALSSSPRAQKRTIDEMDDDQEGEIAVGPTKPTKTVGDRSTAHKPRFKNGTTIHGGQKQAASEEREEPDLQAQSSTASEGATSNDDRPDHQASAPRQNSETACSQHSAPSPTDLEFALRYEPIKMQRVLRYPTRRRSRLFAHRSAEVLGVYTMKCPKETCSHTFHGHPLLNQRARTHLNKCGFEFEDEQEMIQECARQVINPNGDARFTSAHMKTIYNESIIKGSPDRPQLMAENFFPIA